MNVLVAIGKSIELDVDVAQFNGEVHDHILRTGLRNLLMDAHASATAKADPDNYIKRSRDMAEKKLASMYAGIVRVQAVGGPRAPIDPVAMVIFRLARKAVQRERAKELAAAPKAERLALLNRLANEYAEAHDAKLRPRAIKIVELESDEAEPGFVPISMLDALPPPPLMQQPLLPPIAVWVRLSVPLVAPPIASFTPPLLIRLTDAPLPLTLVLMVLPPAPPIAVPETVTAGRRTTKNCRTKTAAR
jgi:hypothetical protein